jgi:hypothetical protein
MLEAAFLLLPVAIGIAIAAATFIVLRESGLVAAESRQASSARSAVAAMDARVEAVLGPVIARIDGVRRGELDATILADELSEASEATAALVSEAEGLTVPAELADVRTGIATELHRAERALDMVEHGRSILASARARGREIEAQTAVKRGYLNLLHAREAIGRYAARAAMYRSPREVRRLQRRT